MATKYNVSLNDIHYALYRCGFSRTKAAKRIGVSRSYIQKRIKNEMIETPKASIELIRQTTIGDVYVSLKGSQCSKNKKVLSRLING